MNNFLFRLRLAISRIVTKIYSTLYLLITRVLDLVEFLLFLRLVLKFAAANPYTTVVSWIYKYSDILVSPFDFIFPNIYWRFHLIETATISAMVGYGILVFLIFEILKLFYKE